jgi:hypothetical protein
VPAIFAVTSKPLIGYTSNACALAPLIGDRHQRLRRRQDELAAKA